MQNVLVYDPLGNLGFNYKALEESVPSSTFK